MQIAPAGSARGCINGASGFTTAEGECRDDSTQLIWASPTIIKKNWHQVIRDDNLDGDTASSDHDYDLSNPPLVGIDKSTENICHSWSSDYSDWRVATRAELLSFWSNGGYNAIPVVATGYYWSSSTNCAKPEQASVVKLSTGVVTWSSKTSKQYSICVRENL